MGVPQKSFSQLFRTYIIIIPKKVFATLLRVIHAGETIGIPRPNAHRSFAVRRILSVISTVVLSVITSVISAPRDWTNFLC